MIEDFGRVYLGALRAKIRAKEESLGSGCAKDWPHYRAITGEIAGLMAAKTSFMETMKQFRDGDALDELEGL